MKTRSRFAMTVLASALFLSALMATNGETADAARVTRCEALFKPADPIYEDADLSKIIESNGAEFSRMGFTTNRGLRQYVSLFRARFQRTIEALSADDAVLDAGCGDGYLSDAFFQPAVNLFDPFGLLPQMRTVLAAPATHFNFGRDNSPTWIGVAKALKDRTAGFFSGRLQSGRFKLLLDHFFEEYGDAELRQGRKIRVITDYFGVLSYSERPDLILQTYLRLLEPNGVVFVGGEPAMLIAKLGRFPDLLRETAGITFQEHVYQDALDHIIVGFEIRLDGNPIKIPELDYVGADYGAPPLRTYHRTGKFLSVTRANPTSP